MSLISTVAFKSLQAVTMAIDRLAHSNKPVAIASFGANIASNTTDGPLVAGVEGKKIHVLLFRLHGGANATSVTFNSKGSGAGTAISEAFQLGANGGRADGYVPIGHFVTNTGEALTATTSASGSTTGIGGRYCYIDP